MRRARVSSQAWKRATRRVFDDYLDKSQLGTRTKRVVELLAERIVKHDSSIGGAERAIELATETFRQAGIKLSAPRRSTKENPLPEESGICSSSVHDNSTDSPTSPSPRTRRMTRPAT